MSKKKSVLAFGVELDRAKYRLRLARYPALVENMKICLCDFDNDESSSKNYNILDVGVGYGRTYVYANAAGITNRFNWHGLDLRRFPSKDRAGGDEWDIKIANIEEGIPYPDNTFDIVVAEQILEHLKNVPFAISELERVTKKGGKLIIGVPIYICPIAWFRNLYIKMLPGTFKKSKSQHIQTFCKPSISRLIEANGILKIKDTRGFRIISGGILRFLENYEWWYKFNCKAGQIFSAFCIEIQMLVEKVK